MRLAVLLTLLILTQPALAAERAVERRYTSTFQDCRFERGEFSNSFRASDKLGCAKDEMTRQDRALNQAWHSALSRLPAARRQALRRQQHDWTFARDKECGQWEKAFNLRFANDESADPWCHIDETIRRILALNRLR